jgi:cytoskeletal protein RodZ
MLTTTQPVRAPRSAFVLWKWTGVSAVLHALLVGALCAVSYMGFAKREAETKAKAAAEEAAAAKADSDASAKAAAEKPPAPPAPASSQSTTSTQPASAAATPAPNILPPPAEPSLPPAATTTAQPPSAEKILGIDKTAKPGDTPKSPFAGGTDDLLKDLK